MKEEASVTVAERGPLTSGIITGDIECIKSQVLQKAKVVEAIRTKAEICSDTQVEHAMARRSLGVGSMSQTLRIHSVALAR